MTPARQEAVPHRIARSYRKALPIGVAAVAAAQLVGGGVAGADGSASYYVAFPNNFYVHFVHGDTSFWHDSQMRRWNLQWVGPLPVPVNTCDYNARFFGVRSDGSQLSVIGSPHSGCSPAGPAWVDSPVIDQWMRPGSYACSEWKEDNTWSHKYTCVTL